MTQTFTGPNDHMTFGTKGRRSVIPKEVRDDLPEYMYMGGIGFAQKPDCRIVPLCSGGSCCENPPAV